MRFMSSSQEKSGISKCVAAGVVASGIFSASAFAAAPGAAPSALAQARSAMDRGDLEAARPILAATAAAAIFELALTESGDARATDLARAAELAPVGDWVRSAAAGVTLLDGEKPAEAEVKLREALTLRGPDKHLQKLIGDALRAASRSDAALVAYGDAVGLDPGYASALVGIGDLKRASGDFTAAYNAYNHALDDQSRPLSALLGRAASRLYLGDKDGAFADLTKAATVAKPGDDRYRALMGYVYAETYLRQLPQGLDRAEQAVAMWQELSRPDMAAAACNATGRVLLETGSSGPALDWYNRGWQIVDGSNLKAEEKVIWHVRQLHGAARVAAQRHDARKAQALADEAKVAMDGDKANADHYKWIYPYLVGYLRWQEKRYPEAVEQLLLSETDRAYVQYLLADSYGKSKDVASARAWYEKALKSASGLDSESVIVRPLVAAWFVKNPAGS
ncbi:MAG: hypothetical protein ABI639_07545 [Thermoanaerobaculia bacterium]